eukprot:SAG11_NODE_145_length_14811_cov_24.558931_9_plen_1225_part_00
MKTKDEKYDRIGHVVGVAFLLLVMFQPVAEGSAVVSVTSSSTNMTHHHNETALVNATNVHTDMNQLAARNDADLKEFIGSLAVELRQLKRENVGIRKENAEMKKAIVEIQKENVEMKNENVETKKENAAVGAELAWVQNRTQIVEAQLEQVTKDKATLENKMQTLESQNAALTTVVMHLSNKTSDFEVQCTAAVHELSKIASKPNDMEGNMQPDHLRVQDYQSAGGATTVRFDQSVDQNWRRTQGQSAGDAENVRIFKRRLTSHLAVHVDEPNGGHRILTENGPADCSSGGISQQITAITTECCNEPDERCTNGQVQTCNAGCGAIIMPFWTACEGELTRDVSKMLRDAVALCPPPDVSFNSRSANMFMATCPQGLPADDCIPMCEEAVNGYLLLLNVNGEDTKMTCELHHLLYSWVGGAADGSYIGEDVLAFISAVLSHAAGIFALAFGPSTTTGTAVDLVSGQSAKIAAAPSASFVTWTYTGSGAAFQIGAGATLQMNQIMVVAASGLAFRLDPGSSLSGNPRLDSGPISCGVLATGIGSSALDCTQDDATGSIMLTGPTIVSTSGTAMPLGSVKYLGDVLTEFTDALYTREVGLYTLDVSTDVRTATAIPVESSMHVTVSGDTSTPIWAYVGTAMAFTVAASSYLTINSMSVDSSLFQVAAGGIINFVGSQLSDSLSVGAGIVSITSCTGELSGVTVSDGELTIDSSSDLLLFGSVELSGAAVDLFLSGQTFGRTACTTDSIDVDRGRRQLQKKLQSSSDEHVSFMITNGARVSIEHSCGSVSPNGQVRESINVNGGMLTVDSSSNLTIAGPVQLSGQTVDLSLARQRLERVSFVVQNSAQLAIESTGGTINGITVSSQGVLAVDSAVDLTLSGSVDLSGRAVVPLHNIKGLISSLTVTDGSTFEVENVDLTDSGLSIEHISVNSPTRIHWQCVHLSFNVLRTLASWTSPPTVQATEITRSRVSVETQFMAIEMANSVIQLTVDGSSAYDLSSVTIGLGSSVAIVGSGSARPIIVAPTAMDGSSLSLRHVSIDCVTALRATSTLPPSGPLTPWSSPAFNTATIGASDVEIRAASATAYPSAEPSQTTCQEVAGALDSVEPACFPDPCHTVTCGSRGHGSCLAGRCSCSVASDPCTSNCSGTGSQLYTGTHCEIPPDKCCTTCAHCRASCVPACAWGDWEGGNPTCGQGPDHQQCIKRPGRAHCGRGNYCNSHETEFCDTSC